jgi:hypothetical protein
MIRTTATSVIIILQTRETQLCNSHGFDSTNFYFRFLGNHLAEAENNYYLIRPIEECHLTHLCLEDILA